MWEWENIDKKSNFWSFLAFTTTMCSAVLGIGWLKRHILIGCAADSADAIFAALHDANIAAARIGTVRPPSFGLQLRRDGHLMPLPTFPVDEITRLFA